MTLARDCQSAYLTAPPKERRLFNQAFFTKLYIDDEDTIRSELAPPFNVLLGQSAEGRSGLVRLGSHLQRKRPRGR